MTDLIGSEWESKDGKRALVILGDASRWCGERMLRVRGTRGSSRERQVSYSGLLRKYDRIEHGLCGHRVEERCEHIGTGEAAE